MKKEGPPPTEWSIAELARVLREAKSIDVHTGQEAAFRLLENELNVAYLRAGDEERYLRFQAVLGELRAAALSKDANPSTYMRILTDLLGKGSSEDKGESE